jgi:hypothetical protein
MEEGPTAAVLTRSGIGGCSCRRNPIELASRSWNTRDQAKEI